QGCTKRLRLIPFWASRSLFVTRNGSIKTLAALLPERTGATSPQTDAPNPYVRGDLSLIPRQSHPPMQYPRMIRVVQLLVRDSRMLSLLHYHHSLDQHGSKLMQCPLIPGIALKIDELFRVLVKVVQLTVRLALIVNQFPVVRSQHSLIHGFGIRCLPPRHIAAF